MNNKQYYSEKRYFYKEKKLNIYDWIFEWKWIRDEITLI